MGDGTLWVCSSRVVILNENLSHVALLHHHHGPGKNTKQTSIQRRHDRTYRRDKCIGQFPWDIVSDGRVSKIATSLDGEKVGRAYLHLHI